MSGTPGAHLTAVRCLIEVVDERAELAARQAVDGIERDGRSARLHGARHARLIGLAAGERKRGNGDTEARTRETTRGAAHATNGKAHTHPCGRFWLVSPTAWPAG